MSLSPGSRHVRPRPSTRVRLRSEMTETFTQHSINLFHTSTQVYKTSNALRSLSFVSWSLVIHLRIANWSIECGI